MQREDSENAHDPESDQIRDVYAYFGLAMYMAQNVERGLAMLLALSEQAQGMTAWDFDARLAESYQSTFGDLVSRFLKSPLAISSGLSERLKRANEQRNDLAHQYFWVRGIQFVSPEGRVAMIDELRQMKAELESLDDDLQALQEADLKSRGEDILRFRSRVETSLRSYVSGETTPHSPEFVPNRVTVVAAEEWCADLDRSGNLVLISKEGRFLIPGERGLCYGPPAVPNGSLVRILTFDGAFPAVVNPRPKSGSPWNYGISLAAGYVLRAQTLPESKNGQFRVWIQGPRSSS